MIKHRTAAAQVVLALASAALLAGVQISSVMADSSASDLPSAWHVHDGLVGLGSQHKGVGFFPTILGLSTTDYQLDPASCPNATDKVFLPSVGSSQSSILRAGACFTSTSVINLRTVPLGTEGPAGWNVLTGTDAATPGGPWVTYYQVTPR